MSRPLLAAWLAVLVFVVRGSEENDGYWITGSVLDFKGAPAHSTTLMLNGGQYWAMSRADGTFTFHDVAPGTYMLEVLSVTNTYSQMKVDVNPRKGIRCLEFKYPGAVKEQAQYPLILKPHQKIKYFEKRETIGLHTLFANPMMVISLFTMCIVVFFPKALTGGIDPEEMKKMQAEMKDNDPQQMFSNMFGGGKPGVAIEDDD